MSVTSAEKIGYKLVIIFSKTTMFIFGSLCYNILARRSAYLMVNIVLKDNIPSSIFILKCLPKSTVSHQGYCIYTTAS